MREHDLFGKPVSTLPEHALATLSLKSSSPSNPDWHFGGEAHFVAGLQTVQHGHAFRIVIIIEGFSGGGAERRTALDFQCALRLAIGDISPSFVNTSGNKVFATAAIPTSLKCTEVKEDLFVPST